MPVLDSSLSIFDHMNGSLFDEFTDYRLNISTYLLFKTIIIRIKDVYISYIRPCSHEERKKKKKN